MPNKELLLEVLNHIKNNPQTWYQDAWFAYFDSSGNRQYSLETLTIGEVNSCNTAYCFAGHVALRTGFAEPPKSGGNWYDVQRGLHVEEHAKNELDITVGQSQALFGSENTLEDLEYMVNKIIEDPEVSYYDLRVNSPSGYEDDEEYDEYDDSPCECCNGEDE
jgi:hypothetical protein